MRAAGAVEAVRISVILISCDETAAFPVKATVFCSHGARPFRACFSFLCQCFPMSTATTDHWGQDIALDDSGQAKVAANGELVLLWHNDSITTRIKPNVSVDWQRKLFAAIIEELIKS